jgi:hypothetical protein
MPLFSPAQTLYFLSGYVLWMLEVQDARASEKPGSNLTSRFTFAWTNNNRRPHRKAKAKRR